MVLITAVHVEGPTSHENITELKWLMENGQTGISTKKSMIEYIEKNPVTVFVKDNQGKAEVVVINASPKYLRTKKDGRLSDNLLSLPRF